MNTDTQQDLDKVILVDNPLDPEKGGFLKAYQEQFVLLGKSLEKDNKTGYAIPPKFNFPMDPLPLKRNIETGKDLSFLALDCMANSDFRTISYDTAKDLNLIKDPEGKIKSRLSNCLLDIERCGPTKRNYIQASYENGFLISLDQLSDRSFVEALDKAAMKNNPDLPKFNDAKYEPQFKKLGQYLKCLAINELQSKNFELADDIPYNKNNCHYNLFLKHKNEDFARFPRPAAFKNEYEHLKAAAHLVTNTLINTYIITGKHDSLPFSPKSGDIDLLLGDPFVNYGMEPSHLLFDMAGNMFAAHLGVPMTQNDVNRCASYYLLADTGSCQISKENIKLPDYVEPVFELAARIANCAQQLDLSKPLTVGEHNISDFKQDLWQQFKNSKEQDAIHKATPSLNEIAKFQELSFAKKDVLNTINSFITQKSNILEPNKTLLEETIKIDSSINKLVLSNFKTTKTQTLSRER